MTTHSEPVVGRPRLEGRNEEELLAVNSLRLESVVESEVGKEDAAPGEETGDGGERDEVVEDDGRALVARKEGEERERRGDGERVDGDAALGATAEEGGGLRTKREVSIDATPRTRRATAHLSVASQAVEGARDRKSVV